MKSTVAAFLIISMVSQLTYSQESTRPSFWVKVTDSTDFSPRDSSPNACVVHDGAVWIFGGWRSDNDTTWYTKSDVWKSDDGIHWESVNDDPPYLPYSAFVSFNGFIWVFGGTSFKSSDGLTWDTVHTNVGINYGSRAFVFQDKVWLTDGSSVFRTDDGHTWEIVLEDAPWEYRTWPGFLAFNNRLWFFGGGISYLTGADFYFNDVWSSTDGINWVREKQNAAWPGRYWFGYQVYDNKMWILGGWDYHNLDNAMRGNLNDTWYTENGIDWFLLPSNDLWPERHAQFVWVFGDAMWMSSGYGGLGNNTLYNDVWKLANTWNDTKIEQTVDVADTITYGMLLPLGSSALPIQTEIVQRPQVDGGSVIPGQYTLRFTNIGNSIFAPLDEIRTVVVQKKDLIVSTSEYYKSFGSPFPEFDLDFDGFVYADDETSIEVLPQPSTAATLYSPVGVYEIVPEGGYSTKYNFVRQPGKIYIIAQELEVVYWPNPVVTTSLTVHLSSPNGRIQLMNSTGQIIMDRVTEENSFTVDMDKLAAGIYFLHVTASLQTRTLRIVKQ